MFELFCLLLSVHSPVKLNRAVIAFRTPKKKKLSGNNTLDLDMDTEDVETSGGGLFEDLEAESPTGAKEVFSVKAWFNANKRCKVSDSYAAIFLNKLFG